MENNYIKGTLATLFLSQEDCDKVAAVTDVKYLRDNLTMQKFQNLMWYSSGNPDRWFDRPILSKRGEYLVIPGVEYHWKIETITIGAKNVLLVFHDGKQVGCFERFADAINFAESSQYPEIERKPTLIEERVKFFEEQNRLYSPWDFDTLFSDWEQCIVLQAGQYVSCTDTLCGGSIKELEHLEGDYDQYAFIKQFPEAWDVLQSWCRKQVLWEVTNFTGDFPKIAAYRGEYFPRHDYMKQVSRGWAGSIVWHFEEYDEKEHGPQRLLWREKAIKNFEEDIRKETVTFIDNCYALAAGKPPKKGLIEIPLEYYGVTDLLPVDEDTRDTFFDEAFD